MPDLPGPPRYVVPSMEEIAAAPWNGLTVVSTFAGGGGSSTGYRMAGFRVLWANEFVPAAADTYQANARPGTIVDRSDIRTVTGATVLTATGLQVGDLDILDGSPPCSAFSTTGKRQAGWGQVKTYSDTAQRVDDLFFEFARLVGELRPKVFVAENVSGLVKGAAKGYFKVILAALKAHGYRVEARLLDAQWLGVPQARQRLIFIGVRDDLGRAPVFPRPMRHRYAVRDVLPALEYQGAAPGFGQTRYAPTDRPSPTLGASPNLGNARSPASHVVEQQPLRIIPRDVTTDGDVVRRYVDPQARGEVYLRTRPATEPSLTVTASGIGATAHGQWGMAATPPAYVHDTSGHFGAGDVTDRPTPTITANHAAALQYRVVAAVGEPGPVWRDGEPYCPETDKLLRINLRVGSQTYVCPPGRILRRLTIPELRILSSFPPDFVLTGTYEQRWERCGRSVPPLMMRAIAGTIAAEVLQCAG